MPKTFYAADPGTGFKVAIFEDGFRGTAGNDLFTNPMGSANSAYLYFHSDLSFFRTPTSIDTNISLPARNTGQDCAKKKGGCVTVPAFGTATYTLASGNYSGKVIVTVDAVTGRSIVGTMFVQRVGDSSFRTVSIYSNSTGIYAEEKYFAYSGNLPVLGVQLKIYILATTTENRTAANEKLFVDPSNMRTNSGLFNSSLGYVDVNTDSVTYTNGIAYSAYYCSWVASLGRQDPNVIRRFFMFDPGLNKTTVFWDAFIKYDGTVEGIYSVVTGNVTSIAVGDYTYERGTLVGSRPYSASNPTIDFYAYQVRRYKTQSTATRVGGAAFPNGPTLQILSDPQGSAAGLSYSFDGFRTTYGEATTYPTNTIYTLNLL